MTAQLLEPKTHTILSSQALAIAEADGIPVYGDLSKDRIEIYLEDDGWHIEYSIRPKGKYMTGGGSHYIISARTGEIVSKKYYQ